MKNRITRICFAVLFVFLPPLAVFTRLHAVSGGEDGKPKMDQIIASAPPIHGSDFKCADMVRVVNRLRSLGKEKAIESLKRFNDHSGVDGDARVFIICRCLFQNPKGWDLPRLGAPAPPVAEQAIKHFPVFPIAFSKRVPFLLGWGYVLDGRPENPAACLKQCESLPLIASDLPTQGYDAAARALVTSSAFREVYPEVEIRKLMVNLVMEQAHVPDTKGKSGENGTGPNGT